MSVLRNIKWSFMGENSRLKILRESDDQRLFYKVAKSDEYPDVSNFAMKKLTDQVLLEKFAFGRNFYVYRMEAVNKISNQIVLSKIALEVRVSLVRLAAIRKITDQIVLSKVAMKDRDSEVRKAAVNKLTDQIVLSNVALKDKNADVRKIAVNKLTDQIVLSKVVLKDKKVDIRRDAFNKLSDKVILAKIPVNVLNKLVNMKLIQHHFKFKRNSKIVMPKYCSYCLKTTINSTKQTISGKISIDSAEYLATKTTTYSYSETVDAPPICDDCTYHLNKLRMSRDKMETRNLIYKIVFTFLSVVVVFLAAFLMSSKLDIGWFWSVLLSAFVGYTPLYFVYKSFRNKKMTEIEMNFFENSSFYFHFKDFQTVPTEFSLGFINKDYAKLFEAENSFSIITKEVVEKDDYAEECFRNDITGDSIYLSGFILFCLFFTIFICASI